MNFMRFYVILNFYWSKKKLEATKIQRVNKEEIFYLLERILRCTT